ILVTGTSTVLTKPTTRMSRFIHVSYPQPENEVTGLSDRVAPSRHEHPSTLLISGGRLPGSESVVVSNSRSRPTAAIVITGT
ncbi:MAG TPA: hypothetical protein VHR66_01485, partial [Gemmataceae bacterium]|nr:hypothetical protein [Gemmataceae bacterium]